MFEPLQVVSNKICLKKYRLEDFYKQNIIFFLDCNIEIINEYQTLTEES